METDLRISLLIASLCLVWISGSAIVPSRELLGIAPQDESYYKSNIIKCKDGSKKFTLEQLNDDFCDCPDGTDEPGTSACPEGKFYCQNTGHVPLTIFSSRVNDGICDCCDGSDEYDGEVSCANTCWEAGKVAREKLKKKIATYQDGVVIRKQEVEKAKQAFIKDEAQLSKLKIEEKILKDLVQKLKEHKELIEKVEEEERLKKEKEEKRLKEAERKSSEQEKPLEESPGDNTKEGHNKWPESSDQDSLEGGQDATIEAKIDHNDETKIYADHAVGQHVIEDHDDTIVKSGSDDDAISGGASPSHVAKQHLEEDQDETMLEIGNDEDTTSEEAFTKHAAEQDDDSDGTDGLSKEELGRLVASRWTGENAAQKTSIVDSTMKEEEHEANQDIPDSAREDDNHGYTSENEEDTHKYDDEEFEDGSDDEYEEDHVEPNGSYSPDEDDKTDFSDFTASNSLSWLEKIQQTVQNVLQSFNFFRTPVDISEAARVRKEYDDSSSKLSKIQSRISSLSEKLKHDFGKDKEFYSFYDHCFESKQNKYVYKVCPFKKASQVEGHSTTQLGRWDKFEESYRVMQFSNGDRCWNGPDRSIKVRLRCGLKNELADVDEPSRCEYVAILSTPALCLEDKLKELQQKLELTNTNQPVSHDEL